MLYHYRCSGCHRLFATETAADHYRCERCQSLGTRVWDFYARASMAEHYNQAVGEYVSNRQQFHDALKRKSDEVSERLGMEHEFVPLTPAEVRDHESLNVPLDHISPIIARDAGL